MPTRTVSRPRPVTPTSRPPRRRRPTRAARRATLVTIVVTLGLLAMLLLGLIAKRLIEQRLQASIPLFMHEPNVAALGAGPIGGPPSIDVAKIRSVLRSYNSPAVDSAQTIYDQGVAYGIDPAYCLAFFVMESRAGTRGIATATHSLGNIRARPGEPQLDGYRYYRDWNEGIADWYRLIAELYIGQWGLTTVDAIVPVYAPATDQNDPAGYARAVKTLVARWRGL